MKTGRKVLVLAVLDDLMAGVRIESAVTSAGMDYASVGSVAEIAAAVVEQSPDLVVLDLAAARLPWHNVIAALGTPCTRPVVVAFFPHVMAELGREAVAAGIDLAVPRSRFMADTAGVLREAIARKQRTDDDTPRDDRDPSGAGVRGEQGL